MSISFTFAIASLIDGVCDLGESTITWCLFCLFLRNTWTASIKLALSSSAVKLLHPTTFLLFHYLSHFGFPICVAQSNLILVLMMFAWHFLFVTESRFRWSSCCCWSQYKWRTTRTRMASISKGIFRFFLLKCGQLKCRWLLTLKWQFLFVTRTQTN